MTGSDGVGGPDGEAGRLLRRLELARARLDRAAHRRDHPGPDAATDPRAAASPTDPRAAASPTDPSPVPGPGAARIGGADDEVRALLGPAASRLDRLIDLTAGIASGGLSGAEAVSALAGFRATQPVRRPR